jgi:hypothetical protein
VHGNADARSAHSGGSIASDRLGRGSVFSGARASPVRGIGSSGQVGFGGEVTDRGAVGGMQARLGVHGGHGDGAGRRRVARVHRCQAGSGTSDGRAAITHWGSMALQGWGYQRERVKCWQGPRAICCSQLNTHGVFG